MKVKEEILHVDKESLDAEAERLFLIGCGLDDKEGSKGERMREAGRKIRKTVDDKIDPKIIHAYFDDVKVEGRKVTIGGEEFSCNGFEQLDPATIKGAWIYVMTAGNVDMDELEVLGEVYAYIWGTSFVDALREKHREILREEAPISDSFGPGFFGMHMKQMKKIGALVDPGAIDVRIMDNGLMLPLKSCAGIYFTVTDKYKRMKKRCIECRGGKAGCSLCNIKNTND